MRMHTRHQPHQCPNLNEFVQSQPTEATFLQPCLQVAWHAHAQPRVGAPPRTVRSRMTKQPARASSARASTYGPAQAHAHRAQSSTAVPTRMRCNDGKALLACERGRGRGRLAQLGLQLLQRAGAAQRAPVDDPGREACEARVHALLRQPHVLRAARAPVTARSFALTPAVANSCRQPITTGVKAKNRHSIFNTGG
jgi:ribosomal protein L34